MRPQRQTAKAKAQRASFNLTRTVIMTGLLAITALALSAFNTVKAMDIKEVTSPGGIKAWLVSEDTVPLVALRFAFLGGSSQDPEDKPGVARFVTAMLDEGAGDLDSQAFQERMQELAMRMGYDNTRDVIYGSFQSLSENLDEASKLLSLALSQPRFDEKAVDRIRRQLLSSLVFASKDPNRIASKAWFETAFSGHPYGRPSNGSAESLKSISADDLRAYTKNNFAKSNLRVVGVGAISEERFGKLLDEVFGALPAEPVQREIATASVPDGGVQKVIELDVPQSVAVFGLKALARKDPDFIPAFVLNHILGGGGFSSKLMQEVREKRGLAYSVYSYLNPLDHAAVMQGGVATKNEAIAESLDVIRGELEKIAKNGVSAEDLKGAQDYLTGSYALRFDTNSKIASQLLGIQIEDLGLEYIETRNDQVRAVTLEDIKRAASRFLDPDDLITIIVGKPEGLEARG